MFLLEGTTIEFLLLFKATMSAVQFLAQSTKADNFEVSC